MSDAASPLDENRLTAQRLGKVEALRASGAEPYPFRFERTAEAAEAAGQVGFLEGAHG